VSASAPTPRSARVCKSCGQYSRDALSEFFEPPIPEDPPRQRHRTPPWSGAPSGTLPGVVPLELVLARTGAVAVCLTRVSAYPSGFECDLVTMSDGDTELDPLLYGLRQRRHGGLGLDGEIPPEMLRFGIEFADGTKATNTASLAMRPPSRAQPDPPAMQVRGGGGGGSTWHQRLWVWPLPPPGPLEFVCEWPAADIPLTRCGIDAARILDAAAQAQVLFSDEHLPYPPSPPGQTD